MREKIDVYNEKVIEYLKEKFPDKWNRLNYAKKDEWITKKSLPTYNQLVEISKVFNIPFGYLFLDKIPEKTQPIPHFRTYNNNMESSISEELYDTIMLVKKQQEWIKDILIDWGQERLPYAGIFNIDTDVKLVVDKIKEILVLKSNWAEERINWSDALKFLIEKIENAGVFVVINGVVGNNTHRKLNVNEFRGFVLYDDIAPFVFINNNDFVSAKIFTLIHELVHILIGQSASFDFRYLQSADAQTEKFCDTCTAEFLVPTSEIQNISEINYDVLAKRFKVSQLVIARRLLDTQKITTEEFLDFYNKYRELETKKSKTKSGDFYNTINYRYGKKFLELLHYAVQNNQILYRDCYKLLSLKPSTSEKILKRVYNG